MLHNYYPFCYFYLLFTGVEGFRRHLSAEFFGTHMFKMSLPLNPNGKLMETVAVVKNEKISILNPVMIGNPTDEHIECA